jgi:hypothetical protein
MRPVTAPCDHDPPSRFSVGPRSPRLDPPDKASDRPLMRPVTVALSSLPRHETDPRSYRNYCPPFQGREERSGRKVVEAQRPERAPRQGCEGKEPHQRRVRAPCASCERVTERLRFRINSDEHDAEHGVRSGPEQPLAGATRQARGVIIPTGNSGKQRGDVSGAGASLRRRTCPSVTSESRSLS